MLNAQSTNCGVGVKRSKIISVYITRLYVRFIVGFSKMFVLFGESFCRILFVDYLALINWVFSATACSHGNHAHLLYVVCSLKKAHYSQY